MSDLERRVRLLERAHAGLIRDFAAAEAMGKRLRDRAPRFGSTAEPPTIQPEPGVDPVPCCPSIRLPETLLVRSVSAAGAVLPAPHFQGELTYNGSGWISDEVSLTVPAFYAANAAGVCFVSASGGAVRGRWLLACAGAWTYYLIAEGISCKPVGSPLSLAIPRPSPGGALGGTSVGGLLFGGSGRCSPLNLTFIYGSGGDYAWGDFSGSYRAIVYEP